MSNAASPPEQTSVEDIEVGFAPKNMTREEKRDLLSQDVRKDFHRISYDLEDFHGLFYQMWDMGYPRLTWEISTAAVQFDRNGDQIDFMFNPVVWKKLDLYTKGFVIGHECLHVMLNHGIRIKNCPIPALANKALDIVVNHMLVNKFGFNRASIDLGPLVEGILGDDGKPSQYRNERGDDIVLCWIDTVFGAIQGDIKRNKPFEYYYALLEENVKFVAGGGFLPGGGRCGGWVLDDHNFLKDFDDKKVQEKIAKGINSKLTDEEKEDFSKKISKSEEGKAAEKASEESHRDEKDRSSGAGNIAGRLVYQPGGRHFKKKRKWETIIKRWTRRWLSKDSTAEQWARQSRRLPSALTDLMVPSDVDAQEKNEQRIDIVFYQDFSGSCFHLKDRFFAAAMSLPVDRFNVIIKCFDTQCYFVDPKDPNLRGGGGTLFDILEDDIQSMIKSGAVKRHPDAIFVITDGDGSDVVPARPTAWHWFLSEDNRRNIPKECNIYRLEDFE